jgi:hypothetical protein
VYRPQKPFRSAKYRAWIRTFPCVACGFEYAIEAAHTGPHGLSQKASDLTCIPLCRDHHRVGYDALDRIGPKRFAATFGIDVPALILSLNCSARARGVLADAGVAVR